MVHIGHFGKKIKNKFPIMIAFKSWIIMRKNKKLGSLARNVLIRIIIVDFSSSLVISIHFVYLLLPMGYNRSKIINSLFFFFIFLFKKAH